MATTTARRVGLTRPAAAVLSAEWLWVAVLVAAAAAARWALVRGMPAPWIFVDELVYSEMAKGLAEHGARTLRDVPVGNEFGLVYPLLLAPAYALYDAVPDAYAAMKVANALVASLAAVPTYLLARRLVRPSGALLAAALAVATPALLYAGTIMTENAFYPAFALASLALVRALERPTWLRAGLLLAALGLAFLVRTQAVALVPAALLAPLVLVAAERRGPRALVVYGRLYALVGGATLATILLYVARGLSPRGALGGYGVVAHGYDAGEVARWALYHLAELDLAVGVAPLAALLLLAATLPSLRRELRIFTAAAVSIVACLLLQVAAFASLPHVLRVEERNLFHVMPLLFVALVAWLGAGAPRPPLRTAAVALAVALLPLALPFERLFGIQAVSDSFGLLPWWDLYDSGVSYRGVAAVAALTAGAVAAVLAVGPSRVVRLLPLAVLAYLLASHDAVRQRVQAASAGALFQGIGRSQPDWIDRAVGRDAEVAVLWSGAPGIDYRVVFENEFFNRSVGRVYDLGVPEPGGLPKETVTPDLNGVLRTASGAVVKAPYVLTDRTVSLAGRPIAVDRRPGAVLLDTGGTALRLSHSVVGVYPDGWSGAAVTYSRFNCRGGRLTVTVQSDGGLFRQPQTVRAVTAGGMRALRVAPGQTGRLTVRLRPGDRACAVTFLVSPTAVPARVQPGAVDERELGMHFLDFRYRP